MPTYQYVCTECGGQLEAVQKFTDEALTVHDDCGGRLRKVFSPVGIVFKGSGFYRTDSRSGGSADPGAGSKPGSDAPAADSKPAGDSPKPGSDSSSKPGGDSSPSPAPASSASSSSGEKVA